MFSLPPLECLRFFEAAARRESFARAATELHVTSAAVAHRIKILETHLDCALFERRSRGVRLNTRGKAYLKDVQRILREIQDVTRRHGARSTARRMRIVSVEAVAEMWLLPLLLDFNASYPDIAVELETNHRNIDPERRDFDIWFAYAGEAQAPRPTPPRTDGLFEDTLFEESLVPVCSPRLLEVRGRPRNAAALVGWPLLYDLGWDSDWAYWFGRQDAPTPDLSTASGFRLYSMVVRAATEGMGVAVGRPTLIARELARGDLVPVLRRQVKAPSRCCLITTAAARQSPHVRTFRDWILAAANTGAVRARARRDRSSARRRGGKAGQGHGEPAR